MIDTAQSFRTFKGTRFSSSSNSNVCACYKCLECDICGRRTTANGVGTGQLETKEY